MSTAALNVRHNVQRRLGRLFPQSDFSQSFMRNKLAMSGLLTVLLLFAVSFLAPWLSPYEPTAIDLGNVLAPPTWGHPLGTDQLGRDILSRMIWGSRISLKVGFVSTGIAILIGAFLGAVAGYYGKRVDALIMRLVDIMLCFPTFFLILAVIAFLGALYLEHYDHHRGNKLDGHNKTCEGGFHHSQGEGFRPSRKSDRGRELADNIRAHLAKRDGITASGRDFRGGGGDPHGVGPQLPGNRRSASHPQLGQHIDGRQR